jgi:hypothetical protein
MPLLRSGSLQVILSSVEEILVAARSRGIPGAKTEPKKKITISRVLNRNYYPVLLKSLLLVR